MARYSRLPVVPQRAAPCTVVALAAVALAALPQVAPCTPAAPTALPRVAPCTPAAVLRAEQGRHRRAVLREPVAPPAVPRPVEPPRVALIPAAPSLTPVAIPKTAGPARANQRPVPITIGVADGTQTAVTVPSTADSAYASRRPVSKLVLPVSAARQTGLSTLCRACKHPTVDPNTHKRFPVIALAYNVRQTP